MEVAVQSVPRIYEPNATEDQTVLIMEGDTRIGAKITQVRTMIGDAGSIQSLLTATSGPGPTSHS